MLIEPGYGPCVNQVTGGIAPYSAQQIYWFLSGFSAIGLDVTCVFPVSTSVVSVGLLNGELTRHVVLPSLSICGT